MPRTASGSSASATGPPAAYAACPSGTANAACVLSQASIRGSALALIPAVRNVRTIRSSRGVVRPSGSPIGIGTRRVKRLAGR